jgi:hypothetical protein
MLPDERKSITHKFSVGGEEGYIIVGTHEEGAPGEISIKMPSNGLRLPASWTVLLSRSPSASRMACRSKPPHFGSQLRGGGGRNRRESRPCGEPTI